MRLRIYDPRILAIDLRHRRLGFSVFEGPRRLLGWGLRVYPSVGETEAAIARKRLAELLKLYSPSAIVVTQERWDRRHAHPNVEAVTRAFVHEAAERSVSIRSIRQEEVRQSFQNLGCHTRYDNAAALAHIFPELASKLPPKRRIWESENVRMIIFDAVALGLSYWQHEPLSLFEPEVD